MTRPHALPIAAVFAVLLQAACGEEPVPPTRVGTFPGPGNELVFLAQHRGWLPPAQFRLVEFINDGEVVRAFRNRSIDAALITIDEVLEIAHTGVDPIILFVSAESRGGDAIIAHPDVTSLADLRGRRVAVQVNSVSGYLLRRALKAAGLSVDDLQIVNLPPDRQRPAFMRRAVDAVVTAEPFRSEILALGGIELFTSASLPFELLSVFVIRGDYLEQRSERASSLCLGWRRSEEDLRTSADARAWVATRMRVTPESLGRMLEVVRLVGPSESQALLGEPTPRLRATTARIQTALVEAGVLPAALPLDPIFRWPASVVQSDCRG
jgi:NitT/TauT family transport system substrate-binding protein